LDLRERILTAYDDKEGTREEIAARFRVSLGMVKKLLLAGRKPTILPAHRLQFRALLQKKNDLTLNELRAASGLRCSLQAINVVLGKMGLTYKKRHSVPANKSVPTWPAPAKSGGVSKRASTRRG
jgi:transposase